MATNRSPKTRQPKETEGGHRATSPSRASEILEASIEALSSCGQDALSQAVCSGILDPKHAVDWVERADRLIRFESDRSALRSEVPALAERLDAGLEDLVCSRRGRGRVAPDGLLGLPGLRAPIRRHADSCAPPRNEEGA